MDILVPLVIIALVAALITKRFLPERWKKIVAKFKK
jgi:hypothetical protein